MSAPVLPALRPGRNAPADLVARRAGIAAATPSEPTLPAGISLRTGEYGGVAGIECTTATPAVELVYFHGGGYRMGSAPGWAPLAGALAAAIDGRVVVPEYRLAPEHPFPAALHDAVAAYGAILDAGPPVFVGGDSAGAGLALALALTCRDSVTPAPSGLTLLSPWLDLTVSAPSYEANAPHDQLFSTESATDAAHAYLQGHDPHDPLVSPALAKLHDLPPAIVFVGGGEVLLDDACSLARGLGAAGGAADLHVVPDVPHVWPLMLPDHAATRRALADIAAFVRRVTERP